MSEVLSQNTIDHLSDPTASWQNVSSERINDVDKAHDMATTEDEFRTIVRKQGRAALEAAMRGAQREHDAQVSVMESNLSTGPIAVERAGQNYDAAQKALLAERNSHRPEWRNVSDERIDDPVKAAHMATVENEWRTRIDEVAQEAKTASQSEHPMASYAAQAITEPNRYDAMVNGPRAVEATGKAYDDLHNPDLPKPA